MKIAARTSSIQTFDSLDFARYSDDGERQVDERVAGLNFIYNSILFPHMNQLKISTLLHWMSNRGYKYLAFYGPRWHSSKII